MEAKSIYCSFGENALNLNFYFSVKTLQISSYSLSKNDSEKNYIFFKNVDDFKYENSELQNQKNLEKGNFEKCILSHLKNNSAYYYLAKKNV
jgi:hypothetical protein